MLGNSAVLYRVAIRASMVGALSTFIPACKSQKTGSDDAAVRHWLLCEECMRGERDSLLARGDRAVPLLAAAIAGPPPRNRENVRRQLEETYADLARAAAAERKTLEVSPDQYVSHFLGNYEALYQSRAITGLVAIATPAADTALADALEGVRAGTLVLRNDVLQQLIEEAPGTWVSISVGIARTCGITLDGRAYCWGANEFGQLGDGTTQQRSRPSPIAGNLRFDSLAAGPFGMWHTCGTASQRVYCWGRSGDGALGDGSTNNRLVPTPVAPLPAGLGFVGIAVGGFHTCGLTSGNRAFCWGTNTWGQLGDGTTERRLYPTPLPSHLGFRSMRAGMRHTCADSLNGQLFCWGHNSDGQLADGSTATRISPTAVPGVIRFRALSLGEFHTCALAREGAADGAAFCAGRNGAGELGDGTNEPRTQLTAVSGDHRFQTISAGRRHTCGIVANTQVLLCWGNNTHGQLGDGSTTARSSPAAVLDSMKFAMVSAGSDHTCAITSDRKAYCWGRNAEGQLGDGTTHPRRIPTLVLPP